MPVINSGYGHMGSTMFGLPNANTVNFFENVQAKIAEKASHYSHDFMNMGKQMFDSVYSTRALELAKAAMNKAGALFDQDIIRELRTMDEFQVAQPTMMRYIMANPVVRERWQDGRCEGYGDSYYDMFPGMRGEDHYDYRMVMDGVAFEVEETGEWWVKQYIESNHETAEHLSVSDKLSILSTWNNVEAMMALAAKDPTSPWNCDL
jgi:hypothetical protein